jgi:nitrogen fixation/metabolism regulation signal transduction histidine kinase
VVAALVLLWVADLASRTRFTVAAAIVALWLGSAWALEARAARPLRALANLLEALRSGDTSFRLRSDRSGDALDEVLIEANALREQVRAGRIETREASAMMNAVSEEVDLALFVLDASHVVRFANRRAERLLGRSADALVGRAAEQVGLAPLLDGDGARARALDLPGGRGRYTVRRVSLRERGLPHELIAIADVGPALREEERQAWQRLMRVLGHEVRNSLAPIRSIASGMLERLGRGGPDEETRHDLRDGLAIIAERSEALGRFLEGYSRLARLPRPALAPVDVAALLRETARFETRVAVAVADGPPLTLRGDRGQIEQVLINLLRNAADAALETGGGVRLGWTAARGALEVRVEDDGPGLGGAENLFVPFFTTKDHGTGIGLVLSRQIAEAHGGTLSLEARSPGPGCVAILRLPL